MSKGQGPTATRKTSPNNKRVYKCDGTDRALRAVEADSCDITVDVAGGW